MEMVDLAPEPVQPEVQPGDMTAAAMVKEIAKEGETDEQRREREKDVALHKGWTKVMNDPSLHQISTARRVVGEFRDMFCDEIPKMPPRREVKFVINLEPGHSLPACPPYRLSYGELDEMKRQLDDYLAKGFIRPSASTFAAPAFFVAKKDGSMRMCIDYRTINKITIKDKYAMPRAEDLLDRLHGAKVFSVLDIRQFFHQLCIRVGDEYKIAISTWYGNYEWLVMPFGMCNPVKEPFKLACAKCWITVLLHGSMTSSSIQI
uniref:Reverse transcriptase domain-containing protein n=1 Tax=Chromera velia CCMP2878 TaxID=1169474 RepID=A0A0G4ICC9_9ALVE|eukprot:Cvel_13106.t1-p1 / transcript=Cvel_13106.t1 / gene=Cvel_13106 / organism=Chromera_velia_CCMP2878 / gene_product=Transposon Ty3-I Gag-Pol polyprotein, putative / transcript_product=Transposon Ty3-I Gag-Pol polyprotein, putative / location=Cvel_scaffold883:20985-21767(+) / protein_length=261 / sequence_SO=supercontig / SO=protein_coding / is_pseudo=false